MTSAASSSLKDGDIMKNTLLARALLGLSACLAALVSGGASAQTLVGGPVKVVVGFAAGGSNDIVARVVSKKAGEILGETLVVVNQPGASGAIAAEAVARAKPDGQTLLLASPSVLTIAPHVKPDLRYHPQRDFVGIGTVAMNAQVMAVNASVKAQNMQEFLSLTKSKDLTMASAGNGALSHLTIELLRLSGGGKLTHIPFKGGAPATNDVVAGHVDGIIMDLPPLKSFIASGRLRALAVTSRTRSTFLPDVPTAIESGMRDVEAVNWFAVLAPKGTPGQTADLLHDAFTKAAKDPAVIKQLADAGIEPMTQASRADFDTFLQSELVRWGKVVETAKIVVKD